MFFTGFKMGFVVGGIFGGLMGTYYAVSYRSFMYIPMAAIGSGSSFGFFMGIGMVMRTEMEGTDETKDLDNNPHTSPYMITTIDPNTGKISSVPLYKPYQI